MAWASPISLQTIHQKPQNQHGLLGDARFRAAPEWKFRVNTLPKFTPEKDSSEVIASLPKDISRLLRRCEVVIIDAVTKLVLCGRKGATLRLFFAESPVQRG